MGLFSAGLLLWVFGFFFEVVGDYQLDRFITAPKNKGKIMTQGLWKYSRHPNYFGESLMWWGMAVMAASLSVYPFIGFVSPVLITFLLLKVSGVSMLEKRWEGNPAWEAYKKRTSVFLPLPPKRAQ
jgi:steroid 5-alpha reductase family enzyme